MRIFFMGTPEFAIKSLEILTGSKYNIVGVMTVPDKPKGRGMKFQSSPVKDKALELKLPLYQLDKLHNKIFKEILDETVPDVIVTVCCSYYINKWIREYIPYGCVNLHPSLLPLYRGTSPMREPILRGDEKTGVTTFYMDRGWDTGDIIIQREILMDVKETAGTLHDKLSVIGSEALLETMDLIEKGIAPRIPQNHALSCYTEKIYPHHGEIDWSVSAVEIERKIRAFNPAPGCFTFYKDKKFKIWDSIVSDEKTEGKSGEILHASCRKGLFVSTGKGTLQIVDLQMPSKKRMNACEFIRGYNLEEGFLLGKVIDE